MFLLLKWTENIDISYVDIAACLEGSVLFIFLFFCFVFFRLFVLPAWFLVLCSMLYVFLDYPFLTQYSWLPFSLNDIYASLDFTFSLKYICNVKHAMKSEIETTCFPSPCMITAANSWFTCEGIVKILSCDCYVLYGCHCMIHENHKYSKLFMMHIIWDTAFRLHLIIISETVIYWKDVVHCL